MKRMLFIIIFMFYAVMVFSQLTVTTGQTPQWYVENVLLGGGVQVSNVQYIGSPMAIGHFTTGPNPTNLGISSGIVLSTGHVNGTPPLGSPVSNFASTDLGQPGDPLLDQIVNGTTYDASILVFNFIPLSDTIRFRYVFASEEYPEYVGSSYNDVFGFFVSGPNPLGGNYNNVNIARIPGTSIAVAINNVNHQSYSQYFVHNEALGGQTIVFDGFTTVFTAWLRVVPCQQYTIRISIADTDDGIYDSAVFLEANSFSTQALSITTTYSLSNSLGYAVEGCNHPIVSFCLPSPATQDYNFSITLGGSATNGIDYQSIPTNYTIPAGQQCITQQITIFEDNQPEPPETIIISTSSACGPINSATITIHDYIPMNISSSGNTTICEGSSTGISVNVANGIPPYTYNWNHGLPPDQSHIVSPSQTTTYQVTVSDLCTSTVSTSITVNVTNLDIQLTASQNPICAGETTTITASGASSYSWSNNAFGSQITVAPSTTTTYSVTGVDNNCSATAQITIQVQDSPVIQLTASKTEICTGEQVILLANGAQNFSWSHNLQGNPVTVAPQTTTTYSVTANAGSACSASSSITIFVHPIPVADFSYVINESSGDNVLVQFFDQSVGNPVLWSWQLGDGSSSSVQNPVNYYPLLNQTYWVTLYVENQFGCSDSVAKPLIISYEPDYTLYIPNAFSPSGDMLNTHFSIYFTNIQENDFQIYIFDRWGKVIFHSTDIHFKWDGTINNEKVAPPGTYVYKIQFRDIHNRKNMTHGIINIIY